MPPLEVDIARARIDALAADVIGALGLPQGAVVGLFAPMQAEAGPVALDVRLRGLGLKTAWPRVTGPDALTFHVLTHASGLTAGYRGLREPPPEAPEIPCDAIALLLVPGLGFDVEGGRLGRGGGFYDRQLARLRPTTPRLALAFARQVSPTPIPRDPHDACVDAVLTEDGLITTTRWPR